jgi:hypothetical protein
MIVGVIGALPLEHGVNDTPQLGGDACGLPQAAGVITSSAPHAPDLLPKWPCPSGQPPGHENYWVTKDGRRRLIAWSNTALLGPDGAVEYVIGTGIDITDQKQAEEALHESQQRFA